MCLEWVRSLYMTSARSSICDRDLGAQCSPRVRPLCDHVWVMRRPRFSLHLGSERPSVTWFGAPCMKGQVSMCLRVGAQCEEWWRAPCVTRLRTQCSPRASELLLCDHVWAQ